MNRLTTVLILSAFLLAACFEPSREAELEGEISTSFSDYDPVVLSKFGHYVVYVESPETFNLKRKQQIEIAENLENIVFKKHPDSKTITVGFARAGPEPNEISYAWKNVDGILLSSNR